jgi:hypothetical protein
MEAVRREFDHAAAKEKAPAAGGRQRRPMTLP